MVCMGQCPGWPRLTNCSRQGPGQDVNWRGAQEKQVRPGSLSSRSSDGSSSKDRSSDSSSFSGSSSYGSPSRSRKKTKNIGSSSMRDAGEADRVEMTAW